MVLLNKVQASNALVPKITPGLVAVFVGATNGIGEYTLLQFAKYATRPRVYFVGRSQEAADQILAQCKASCPEGQFNFIKSNISLIRNVDEVCQEIKSKENTINILCMSQGTLVFDRYTEEGLNYALALVHYSRARFLVNLLPLIQQASGLRRVLTIFAGTKEGQLYKDDIDGKNVPLRAGRGHMAAVLTNFLEEAAKKAPEVSFIHNFPGFVRGGVARETTGVIWTIVKAIFAFIGLFAYMKNEECGDRHLFLLTSARYPPKQASKVTSGVSLTDGIAIANGIDSELGSGVYVVTSDGESAGPQSETLMAKQRTEKTEELVWQHTNEQFKRIVGSERI